MEESQLRKGALDLAVLALLARGDSYGYELTQALIGAGFDGLGDATIYGTMRRMEQSGLVTSRLEPSPDGPARKYYALTADGKHQLQQGAERWQELATTMRELLGPS